MGTAGPDQEEAIPDGDAVPICECCLEPVPEDCPLFCPKCGAPIDSLAAVLPFERIFAGGYLIRQAAEHPRKLITVIGIWLLFLITAIYLSFSFLVSLLDGEVNLRRWKGFVDTLIFLVVVAIYFAIGFRVTRAYLAFRSAKARNAVGPSRQS